MQRLSLWWQCLAAFALLLASRTSETIHDIVRTIGPIALTALFILAVASVIASRINDRQ